MNTSTVNRAAFRRSGIGDYSTKRFGNPKETAAYTAHLEKTDCEVGNRFRLKDQKFFWIDRWTVLKEILPFLREFLDY